MHVSWDDRNMICPEWPKRRHGVLNILAAHQKNATEEAIPLLPEFEAVLLETPENERTGWVFKPESLQNRVGRKPRTGRPDAEWVGKVISRIGEKANVVVHPGDRATGRPAKSPAHDLRRSCADRLSMLAPSRRRSPGSLDTRKLGNRPPTLRPRGRPEGRRKTAGMLGESDATKFASVDG